jgi:prepilin-type N-terminal cleavage/methylation domain-containing protein
MDVHYNHHLMRRIKGFTLGELLIVVAIIAVLVGVSIPVFSGQLRKASVATNKANIRSARAAAMAKMYDDISAGKFKNTDHAYYHYDIKTGTISTNSTYYNGTYEKTEGKKMYDVAMEYIVCQYIMVYVAPSATGSEANIQTAPYYTEAGGDLPVFTYNQHQKPNYYGPDLGGVK